MRKLVTGSLAILAAVIFAVFVTNIVLHSVEEGSIDQRKFLILKITWAILLVFAMPGLFILVKVWRKRTYLLSKKTDRSARNQFFAKESPDQNLVIREVLKAQENERNKIAQELHDNVNQILASTKLYLHMVHSEHPRNIKYIEKSIQYLDEAVAEIRKLSSNEVTPLKEINLQELISSFIDSINDSGITSNLRYNLPESFEVEEDLKLNIYRIIQEQVNNTLKHAHATTVEIVIEGKDNHIYLSISDNGKGFDPSKERKGIGISNMINRVKSYNGEIDIKSEPGKGCSVYITLPLNLATSQYHSLLRG